MAAAKTGDLKPGASIKLDLGEVEPNRAAQSSPSPPPAPASSSPAKGGRREQHRQQQQQQQKQAAPSLFSCLGCFGGGAKSASSSKVKEDSSRTAAGSRPAATQDDLMPFRKTNQRIEDAGTGTSSLSSGRKQVLHGKAAEEYMTESTTFTAARSSPVDSGLEVKDPLTIQNISQKCTVVRGPHWSWAQEDGGRGSVGTVLSWDTKTNTATVRWRNGNTFSHYRLLRNYDLSLVVMKDQSPRVGAPGTGSIPMSKRNSQGAFADASQSIIIFDWDDTLFPTTYVRIEKQLKWHKPLQQQAIKPQERQMIAAKLSECARHVVSLLKMADEYGKVMIVTLAKNPWVVTSCKNFYPQVGQVLEELQIPIIYAQEGVQVDYNKTSMMADEELEMFWSGMKGKAITREVEKFYSQYEGQSWKNIISVGDSDFERLGTRRAIAEYMEDKGLDPAASRQVWQPQHGVTQMIKVRTKTFKLVDQPTADELNTEVTLLEQWLPLMVTVDKNFDINLEDMEGPPHMWGIEEKLRSGSMALPVR
mmetsp:Transcript_21682/g.50698  ORF Transcript_21682/g.50698 Transcript_21682/m.50698 type:complete len:533 (+) Transcript_21682:67-1665(+)